jgi:hypothetical protein
MKGIYHNGINYFFLFVSLTLLNSCEKEVFVEPKSVSTASYMLVYINSNPKGAEIYVDGKKYGTLTPDTIKWLEEKNHSVTLRMQYFFDTTFVINPALSQSAGVFIDYYKSDRMLGSIIFTSQPAGAAVYLDNVNTGKVTPVTFTHLIPKVYSVKYDCPEYRKDSTTITLNSMKTEKVYIELDDTLDVIKFTTLNSDLPQDVVTGLAEDKYGNIWIGTGSEGLAKYDGKRFTKYRMENSPFVSSNFIKKIKSDNEHNLWIGYSNSIVRYDGTNWKSIAADAISMIQIGADNTMLASTDQKGIVKYSNGEFQWITEANSGLPSNELVSMCYDNSGRLWAAPRTGDLFYKDGEKWTKVDSAKGGLLYKYCGGINLTNDGHIIAILHPQPDNSFGVAPHTLAMLLNGAWSKMLPDFSASIDDKDLYIDNKNRTWYSYLSPYPTIARISNILFKKEYFYYSIIKHDIRKFESWEYSTFESFFNENQAFIDSKGNLWLYGYNGLIKIKAGRWND